MILQSLIDTRKNIHMYICQPENKHSGDTHFYTSQWQGHKLANVMGFPKLCKRTTQGAARAAEMSVTSQRITGKIMYFHNLCEPAYQIYWHVQQTTLLNSSKASMAL